MATTTNLIKVLLNLIQYCLHNYTYGELIIPHLAEA